MATAPSLVNTMLASKSMKQKSDDEVHRQGGGQLSVLLAGELGAELSEKVQPASVTISGSEAPRSKRMSNALAIPAGS